MIVFIDELDRCRPDFALGILEVLKHFFRTDGVNFVLVTSKEYLKFSVDQRYGVGFASSEYLEKFYDFIYIFEDANNYNENSVKLFIRKTQERYFEIKSNDDDYFVQELIYYCIRFKLTLRQIENFCINACLAYVAVRESKYLSQVCWLHLLL